MIYCLSRFFFSFSLEIRCWLDSIYISIIIYDSFAINSVDGVLREIVFGSWTYFVNIGISITVVCLYGIDDFDVDGRRSTLYNEETLVTLSIGERLKFGDNIGIVCIIAGSCWNGDMSAWWFNVLTPRIGKNTSTVDVDRW